MRGKFLPRPGHRRDGRRRRALAADGTRRGARGRQQHGLSTLRRVMATLGGRPLDRALDARSALARELHHWRQALITDLGGEGAISTQQRQLIELGVRARVMLDSVDVFVFSLPSLINKRRRALFPIVLQRQSLARELASLLDQLGLERRKPAPKALSEYLSERYGGQNGQPASPASEARERPSPPSGSSPALQTAEIGPDAPQARGLEGS